MYYIYKHTSPNGKMYIGQTTNPEKRFNNGKGYQNNPKFYNDILKYGWNNIKHEILYVVETDVEARKYEKKSIKEYDAINKGYNRNGILGERKSTRKTPLPVYLKYDKEGNFIKQYVGNKELRQDGYYSPDAVRQCCKGRIKTHKGFIWKFA